MSCGCCFFFLLLKIIRGRGVVYNYSMLGDEWYVQQQPLSDKQHLDAASYPSNHVDNHQQLLLLAAASSSQPNQQVASLPFYNVPSSSSSSASPHMMIIPNFSSLLDSSSSSSNCAPVIEMNDNNEEFLNVAAGRHLQTPTPPPAMESMMRDFVSPSPLYSGCNSTPAILQLLSALNSSAGDISLSPLPGAVAGVDYGPPALNFFHASPSHQVNVASGASFDTFTHNLGQLAAAGVVAHDVNGSTGFLNLFNKEGCYGHNNTTPAPSPTNPHLQLQPLDVYPPMGSPPTLFQKRAAQRRSSATSANILASPPAKLPTPSSSSSKTKSVVNTAYHAAMGSPSSIKGNSKLGHMQEWPTKQGTSHVGFNSSSCHDEGAIGEQVGDMEDLVDDVNEGEDHVLSENQAAAATIGDRVVTHLAEELEADEDCEALFHMSDQDHHISNVMDGVGGALETSADDQGASQLGATAGSVSVSAGAEHNGANATANRGGGGRGKVKGPPAKNLMAERRRRKKLNDRLYTLRSVVPKISKMDRASILGDAIEYLKELLQRINDLHNELEATAPDNRPGAASLPPTPNSFMNQSSLTPTSTSTLPSFVKLEECGPSSSTMQVMTAGPDPTQPPKIDVRTKEGRALNIHMFCARRPGLLLSTMRALDGLGLDVQQAVISCFNGFALDIFRAEQSQEDDVAADEIKRVLLLTATSAV